MDDELVLLTSYFNLANGRRQDTAETFRVDPSVPSATSPDGTAALYIVTEASTGSTMGNRARRLVADTVAWEYARHGEDQPPARLKAALRAADEAVRAEFDGHVCVGSSVMAVEQDTVYLAQAAPAQVYVLHEGSLHSITASFEGNSGFERALGSSSGTRISVFRDQIGPEDVVALCSSWYNRGAEPDEMREAFGAGNADDIAASILEIAKERNVRDIMAVVVEAALASELANEADEDVPASFSEQVDIAVQALASVGRMILSELRPQHEPEDGNGHQPIPPYDDSPFEPQTRAQSESHGSGAHPLQEEEDRGIPGAGVDVLERDEEQRDPWDTPPPPRSARPIRPSVDGATDEVPIVPNTPDSKPDTARRTFTSGAPSSGSTVVEPEPEPHWEPEPQPYETEQYLEPGQGSPYSSYTEETEPYEPEPYWEPQGHAAPEPYAPEPYWEPEPQSHAAPEPEQPPKPLSELDQVNSRIQSSPDLGGVIPPVQAFPDTSTEPSRIYATSKDIQAANRRPRRFARAAGRDSLDGPTVIRPGMSDVDLRRPIGRPTPPAVIWLGAVAFLVLAAASGYLFIKHRHTVTIPPNPYPALVRRDLALAQGATRPEMRSAYLTRAEEEYRQAKLHGASPAALRPLAAGIRQESDVLHHITRVTSPVLLSDFSKFPGAQAAEIATAPGLVFVLDTGRHSVFSVTPNSTSNPVQIVTTGENDSGFTVGNLKQIAADGATVLVLDDHNVLIRDAGGTKTATSLPQALQTPPKIVSLGSLDPDAYLLDTSNSQLWRYPDAVSGYNPAPSAYFDSTTPTTPNLKSSVSFAFDRTDLYILSSNGTVLKFDLQANPQPFTIHLHTPLRNPIQLYTDPGQNYIWIADPANGRIVQLNKDGSFARTYRSGTASMDLHTVKSISTGPAGNTLYVLAGSKLFDFPVVH